MRGSPLGDLGADRFLRKHWQRKPLVVRNAVPEVEHIFSATQMMELACRDDVESRLVIRSRGRWQVAEGPFRRRVFKTLPERGWTLLVHGVESHLEAARALLARFAFIPYARHDDLMVSVAPTGGGVGPHFDSYDVFLLQARGRRRWRLSSQSDLRLVARAPLKILQRFTPTEILDVEPGDLLYLPPNYAHDGVAQDDCITCSVGFRAPSRNDLCVEFLQWLQEQMHAEGRYADRDLALQDHPARISLAMVQKVENMLSAIRWRRGEVARFLGEFLTEPKAQTWFARPAHPMSLNAFAIRARARGIRLALKSRMLFDEFDVFVNGERCGIPAGGRAALLSLGDRRELKPWPKGADAICSMLHAWYKCGYVELL